MSSSGCCSSIAAGLNFSTTPRRLTFICMDLANQVPYSTARQVPLNPLVVMSNSKFIHNSVDYKEELPRGLPQAEPEEMVNRTRTRPRSEPRSALPADQSVWARWHGTTPRRPPRSVPQPPDSFPLRTH